MVNSTSCHKISNVLDNYTVTNALVLLLYFIIIFNINLTLFLLKVG